MTLALGALSGLALSSCGVAPLPSSNISGPGWTLVREGANAPGAFAAPVQTVGFAGTTDAVAAMWPFAGPPKVDLGTQVLVRFTESVPTGGGACDIARLRRVVVNVGDRLIFPLPKDVGATGCAGGATAYSFVIAVDRVALPPAPFVVQVAADPPTTPGATLTVQASQVGVGVPDKSLGDG